MVRRIIAGCDPELLALMLPMYANDFRTCHLSCDSAERSAKI